MKKMHIQNIYGTLFKNHNINEYLQSLFPQTTASWVIAIITCLLNNMLLLRCLTFNQERVLKKVLKLSRIKIIQTIEYHIRFRFGFYPLIGLISVCKVEIEKYIVVELKVYPKSDNILNYH